MEPVITPSALSKAVTLLRDSYSVDVHPENIDLGAIQALYDPAELTDADLFKALDMIQASRFRQTGSSPAELVLRLGLGYPVIDTPGTITRFSTLTIEPGVQVAVTRIRPLNNAYVRAPIIFTGGMFCKSALYMTFMAELAKQEGREIILFDLPGFGGSKLPRDKKVSMDLWVQAFHQVIEEFLGPQQKFVLMAHSLGTLPLRVLSFHAEKLKERVEKWVFIAPVPSRQEEKAGYQINPWILRASGMKSFFTTLFDWNSQMVPTWPEKAYQNHPVAEQNDLTSQIMREKFPVGWLSQNLMETGNEKSLLEELQKPGSNKVWILPGEDELIQANKAANFSKNKNVMIFKGADHAFLMGNHSTKKWVGALQHILNAAPQNGPQPAIEPVGIQTKLHLKTEYSVGSTFKAPVDFHWSALGGVKPEMTWRFLPFLQLAVGSDILLGADNAGFNASVRPCAEIIMQGQGNQMIEGGLGMSTGGNFADGKNWLIPTQIPPAAYLFARARLFGANVLWRGQMETDNDLAPIKAWRSVLGFEF